MAKPKQPDWIEGRPLSAAEHVATVSKRMLIVNELVDDYPTITTNEQLADAIAEVRKALEAWLASFMPENRK